LRRSIEALDLSAAQREQIFAGNARALLKLPERDKLKAMASG
jgi:hypothetical protein